VRLQEYTQEVVMSLQDRNGEGMAPSEAGWIPEFMQQLKHLKVSVYLKWQT
jgi:hypothetical protein